jgi:uracil-DNA glycosylase family 4
MFTGDRSGQFLYRALWESGFANQPSSVSKSDGLELLDAYITAPVRCVPPQNRPDAAEIRNCRPYLVRELQLLANVQVVVVLGGIALNAYLTVLQHAGKINARSAFPFCHGATFRPSPGGPVLLACYHPSQQNTSTGRLTLPMLEAVFSEARKLVR